MSPPSRYSQWQSDVAWYIRGPLLVDCILSYFLSMLSICVVLADCGVQCSGVKSQTFFCFNFKDRSAWGESQKVKDGLKTRAGQKQIFRGRGKSWGEGCILVLSFFFYFLVSFIYALLRLLSRSLFNIFFLSSSVCFFVLYLTIPTVICLLNWSSNSRNSLCPSLVDLLFQIQQYSRNIDELKSQLGLSQDKLHKRAQEATNRDEQLVVLKVELATLQEKHRLIQDEVNGQF